MTQPSFVPIARADQVRPALHLEVHQGWVAKRPGEIRFPARPGGRTLGAPGPDQGYALRLARRFESQLQLDQAESAEDVILGCALLAARRAGLFGRAPCIFDLVVVYELFGFLGPLEPALVAERAAQFRGLSHDYSLQRRLVDSVPEDLLRKSHSRVPARPRVPEQILDQAVEPPADPTAPAPTLGP
jgi:hypothetical protein